MAEIDPLLVGSYLSKVMSSAGYERGPILPPLADGPTVLFGGGVGPLRSWLVSSNEEYVVQIQPDRLYFNWRQRGGEYPHFHDQDGRPGVLSRGLAELERFNSFCVGAFGGRVTPSRIELAKIDQLRQGTHFDDLADLASLMEPVAPLLRLTHGGEPLLSFQLHDRREDCELFTAVSNSVFGPAGEPAVQIEMRAVGAVTGTELLGERFAALNAKVNELFFSMVNDAPAWQRFGGLKS